MGAPSLLTNARRVWRQWDSPMADYAAAIFYKSGACMVWQGQRSRDSSTWSFFPLVKFFFPEAAARRPDAQADLSIDRTAEAE
jgi:hypothetical protein